MEDHLKKFIVLSQASCIGPVTQNRLLMAGDGITGCYELCAEELIKRDRMLPGKITGKKRILQWIRQREAKENQIKAEEILRRCSAKDVSVVTTDDRRYPSRFQGIVDMPCVLYIKGSLQMNDYGRSLGIVGARRCTQAGKRYAIEQAEAESRLGSAIVSGMAKGIDSYAHTAALKTGGYTIAVLGNGPDICYPREHNVLYEEISHHGCILSEYPPGTEPHNYMFPLRNRLIAALSDELLVVDAGRRSGTDTTVDNCRKYGRPVRFVPGEGS